MVVVVVVVAVAERECVELRRKERTRSAAGE